MTVCVYYSEMGLIVKVDANVDRCTDGRTNKLTVGNPDPWIAQTTGEEVLRSAYRIAGFCKYSEIPLLRQLEITTIPLLRPIFVSPICFLRFQAKQHIQTVRPRSDSSFRSSLIRIYTVCHSSISRKLHKSKSLTKKVRNKVLEILGHLPYSIYSIRTIPPIRSL